MDKIACLFYCGIQNFSDGETMMLRNVRTRDGAQTIASVWYSNYVPVKINYKREESKCHILMP